MAFTWTWSLLLDFFLDFLVYIHSQESQISEDGYGKHNHYYPEHEQLSWILPAVNRIIDISQLGTNIDPEGTQYWGSNQGRYKELAKSNWKHPDSIILDGGREHHKPE